MTDIDAMQAGPELDRLIAERVMGWEWYSPGHYAMAADGAKAKWTGQGSEWHHDLSWSPSTNIAHAWEVVALMRSNQIGLIINDTGGRYRARFMVEPWSIDRWVFNPNDGLTVWEDTAPLAICRCALKASMS